MNIQARWATFVAYDALQLIKLNQLKELTQGPVVMHPQLVMPPEALQAVEVMLPAMDERFYQWIDMVEREVFGEAA